MGIRGTVTYACDTKGCRVELVMSADDADLMEGRSSVKAQFVATEWVLDENGDLHCAACCAEGREKGDDDGREYADPRDEDRYAD